MSLWYEIQPFIDESTGLMTASDGGKDNLILMSAYLLRELKNNEENEAAEELLTKMQCFLADSRVSTGLYRRMLGDISPNSIDNLIGTCYTSFMYAEFIRQRWNSRFSCFDVNNPDKIALNQNFFGRFIGVKAFIVAAAHKRPWFIQRLLWCASTLFSMWTSSGASGPLLNMLQCDYMAKWCPRTVKYWRSRYFAKSLYSEYFGPNFPLVKYSKN